MTTFQLDQNVNRKTLARRCFAEGRAVAKRFPVEWKMYDKGFKDPQLLPIVMAGNRPLVTNDRRIASDYADIIPTANPGIIIVGYPLGHICPLRRGEIEKIIWDFKSRFPIWDSVTWSNSVVEITPEWVEVSHIDLGILNLDERIDYSDGWAEKLENHLKINANKRLP